MSNTSGTEALGRAVLVKLYEPERHVGMIHIPDIIKERSSLVEQRAIIVDIGPMAWDDERVRFLGIPLWRKLRARVGEKVLVTKFAGYVLRGPLDGELYRMVNCNDIFCKITAEAETAFNELAKVA